METGVTPLSVYAEKLFHTFCLFVFSHSYLKHRQNQLKSQTYPQTPCFGPPDPLSPGIFIEVLSTFHITPPPLLSVTSLLPGAPRIGLRESTAPQFPGSPGTALWFPGSPSTAPQSCGESLHRQGAPSSPRPSRATLMADSPTLWL